VPRTSMLDSLLQAAATPRPDPDPPPPPAGTALAAGASRIVEAATTEQALAEISQQLGPDARIVDARRVRRGGLGGFFAKESVQLHVAPVDTAAAASASATSAVHRPSAVTDRAGSPVDRIIADLDAVPDDVDFAAYLRDQLTPAPTDTDPVADDAHPVDEVVATTPASSTVGVIAPWQPPAVEPASSSNTAGWSRDALIRLGLPGGFVRTLEPTGPDHDLAWTTALTEALRPTCRPLPAGPAARGGPRAAELDLTTDEPATVVARSMTWTAAMRHDRWVHLVVGGDRWREGLAAGPAAVGGGRDEALAEEVRTALELGLVLGYGPGPGRARRARPFDVALAVRAQLVGRGGVGPVGFLEGPAAVSEGGR
jgi:hypothetical protein